MKQKNDEENFSYVMTMQDVMAEELDKAIEEVTHLLSLSSVKSAPHIQRQLFDIGCYFCKERKRLNGEPADGIRFRKLPMQHDSEHK